MNRPRRRRRRWRRRWRLSVRWHRHSQIHDLCVLACARIACAHFPHHASYSYSTSYMYSLCVGTTYTQRIFYSRVICVYLFVCGGSTSRNATEESTQSAGGGKRGWRMPKKRNGQIANKFTQITVADSVSKTHALNQRTRRAIRRRERNRTNKCIVYLCASFMCGHLSFNQVA